MYGPAKLTIFIPCLSPFWIWWEPRADSSVCFAFCLVSDGGRMWLGSKCEHSPSRLSDSLPGDDVCRLFRRALAAAILACSRVGRLTHTTCTFALVKLFIPKTVESSHVNCFALPTPILIRARMCGSMVASIAPLYRTFNVIFIRIVAKTICT